MILSGGNSPTDWYTRMMQALSHLVREEEEALHLVLGPLKATNRASDFLRALVLCDKA